MLISMVFFPVRIDFFHKKTVFFNEAGWEKQRMSGFGPWQAMGDLRDVVNDEMQNTMTQAPMELQKHRKTCIKRTSRQQTKALPTSFLQRKGEKLLLHRMLEQVSFNSVILHHFLQRICHFLRRVTWCLYVFFDVSICSMIKCTVYKEVFLQHYIAL